jgi:hypothetical protein
VDTGALQRFSYQFLFIGGFLPLYQYTNSGEGCKQKIINKSLKNNTMDGNPAVWAAFTLIRVDKGGQLTGKAG